MRAGGRRGRSSSVFPPLSPVAWTGVMTGKNSGKHGVFEFLEYAHDPLGGRVNSSRAIQAELVWEIAGRHGKTTVAGGVPMSYPPPARPPGSTWATSSARPTPPTSPATRRSSPSWSRRSGPYRPWSTAVHDGGNEAEALAELTGLPRPPPQGRPVPDGPVRVGPLHVRPDGHRPHPARALARLGPDPPRRRKGRGPARRSAPGCVEFWKTLDRGHRRDRGGAAARHGADPDERPRLRADRVVRQLQRLAPRAGRHRASRTRSTSGRSTGSTSAG